MKSNGKARCNMKISKGPLPVWAISLPRPLTPANMRLGSAEWRRGGFDVLQLCPSASRPHPTSAPQDEPEQFPYTNGFLEEEGEGCVVDGVQIG